MTSRAPRSQRKSRPPGVRRAGPCPVQLRGAQRPGPQMEVGEVAAEGVTRLEAAAQRILVLAQNEDAARWQWVARA